MDEAAGRETFETPEQPSRAPAKLSGRWRFTAGLLSGLSIALITALAPSLTLTAATRQASVRPQTQRAPEPDDEALAARWATLYGRFLETAAPLVEAFNRADRLAEELPERQIQVREAEDAYRAASRSREDAERELAAYLEKDVGIEQKTVQAELTHAELTASEAQAKLDDLRRVRQKVINSWLSQGRTQQSAESVAKLLFDKDVWTAENRLQQALHGFEQARARRDLVIGFDQMRKAKIFRAEVEARRARELACLAAWERARSRQAHIHARIARSDLSQRDRRLLDHLLQVVRKSGARPAPHADRAEMQAFLDRFEASLIQARDVSRRLRAERYDDLLDRLVRAREWLESK
jgi:hypothetical protein